MELSTSTLSALHTGPCRLQSVVHICVPFLLYDTIDLFALNEQEGSYVTQNKLSPLSAWHRYLFHLAIPAQPAQ